MNREEEEEWRRRCATEACRRAFDKVAEVYDVLADPAQRQWQLCEEKERRRCATEACRHAFDKVAEVYDALADPTQRQLYNQNGRLGLREKGGGMASRRDPGARFHTLFQQAMNVTFSDGWTVLEILYDIGWLRSYLRQRQEREQEDPELKLRDDDDDDDDDDDLLECEHYFQFARDVKTDSFGRITSFYVPPVMHENDVDELVPYDLPPSVSRLHQLRKLRIGGCCQRIPAELGDLPFLTEIEFCACTRDVFDNIPAGLQLPHLQRVSVASSDIPNSLVPFLNSLPNGLEELYFGHMFDRVESNRFISALYNNEFEFHQSLITFGMPQASVDDDGFELLLFKVLPRFPNLRNLMLYDNNIQSLRGTERKIRELGSVFNTKLVRLDLWDNPVFSKGLRNEKSPFLLLLNTFDNISNLGGASVEDLYDPDIEGALRNNLMKRPFTDGGITGTWPSNAALWPFMMEKVYNNSWQVYSSTTLPNFIKIAGEEKETRMERYRQEQITKTMNKRCATELFHMVRYGPIFAVDQCPQHEITTATTAPATKKQRTKK